MTNIINSKNDFYKNLISLCKKVGEDFTNGKITDLSNEKWCIHKQLLDNKVSSSSLEDKMIIGFKVHKEGPLEVALDVVYADNDLGEFCFVAKQIISIIADTNPSINGRLIIFVIENKIHYILEIDGVKQEKVFTLL